jgi:hypothetical protein
MPLRRVSVCGRSMPQDPRRSMARLEASTHPNGTASASIWGRKCIPCACNKNRAVAVKSLIRFRALL